MTQFNKTKKIVHVWSILCGSSSIDQQTKSLSLFNILEQLEVSISKKPKTNEAISIPMQYQLVSLLKKGTNDEAVKGEQRIKIVDPNDADIGNFIKEFEISPKHKRVRIAVSIRGFKITSPGVYLFKVGIREDGQNEFSEVAEIPLEVSIKIE